MEQKMLEEFEGLLADINPAEIVSHFYDGTLVSWLMNWKMKVGMLVAFLIENEKSKRDGG